MNSETRAALQKAITEIREVTEYIDREAAPVGTLIKTSTTLLACPADMSQIRRNLDVIDRLLIDRAMPEPDAQQSDALRAVFVQGASRWADTEDDYSLNDFWNDVEHTALQAAAHGDADSWLDDLAAIESRYDIVITEAQIRTEGGEYRCDIYAGVEADDPMMVRIGYGTGPTRKAAIMDAVAKARKEATDAN